MLKIKLTQLVWACLAALAISYPVSAWAASVALHNQVLPAPFLLSWVGVWVFSAAGGLCAAFVKIPEIDARFHYPSLAKAMLGLFTGVALCSFIDTFTETQSGLLTFFALGASLFSAPITAGAMVWLSNQKRMDKALNQLAKRRTGVDVSLDSDEELK